MKTTPVPTRHLSIRQLLLCLTILGTLMLACAATTPADAASPCGHPPPTLHRVMDDSSGTDVTCGGTRTKGSDQTDTRPPLLVKEPTIRPVKPIGEFPNPEPWNTDFQIPDKGGDSGGGGGFGDSSVCNGAGGRGFWRVQRLPEEMC